MSKGLVFVCFLASLCWCVTDAVEFTFDIITHNNSTIECKQNVYDKANVTVLENQELILKATGKNLCYILECTIVGEHNEVKSDVKDYILPRQLSVTVTKVMGTTWNCSILMTNEAGIVQPVYNYYGKTRKDRDPKFKTYSVAYCAMQLHVRREITPQNVLVNNMILPTIQETNNELPYDHSAVYNYFVGDLINASCINNNTESENTPKLSFTYDYAKRFYEGGRAPESFNIKPNSIGYGFRTTMGTEHDKHVMICKYWDEYDYTIIKITFIAANQFENVPYFEVNRHKARITDDKNENSLHTFMVYNNEEVSCFCPLTNDRCKNAKNPEYYECGGKTYGITTKTFFAGVKSGANSYTSINVPEDKNMLEFYNYVDDDVGAFTWIYYGYDEYDPVSLECSNLNFRSSPSEIVYKLNGTDAPGPFTKKLTAIDNRLTFECILKDSNPYNNNKEIYKYTFVQFIMNEQITSTVKTNVNTTPQTTETTTLAPRNAKDNKNDDTPNWLIAVVAIIMIIVIVAVIMVIYKMRKRGETKETDRNNILQSPSESSIPPYPPQWTATEEQTYHVPVDLKRENNEYAVPFNAKESPYAVPIPKSKRKEPELIYAELTHKIAGSSKSKEPIYYDNEPTYADPNFKSIQNEESAYSTVTDLYSKAIPKNQRTNQANTELYTQVLPKSQRKNNKNEYGNVFPDSPYVNSANAEYVEPTYVEAPRK